MSAVATQIHDYNPGIRDNGVFWTIPVAASSVTSDVAAGRASFELNDYAIDDYTSFGQSLTGTVAAPAVVSFAMTCEPGPTPYSYEQVDRANGFGGEFIEGMASIAWSSKQDGFEFESDPASTSTSLFSIVGHERNGVFLDAPATAPTTTTTTSTAPSSGGESLANTGSPRGLAGAGALALLGGLIARRLDVAAKKRTDMGG